MSVKGAKPLWLPWWKIRVVPGAEDQGVWGGAFCGTRYVLARAHTPHGQTLERRSGHRWKWLRGDRVATGQPAGGFFPEPLEGGLASCSHLWISRTYLPVRKVNLQILNVTDYLRRSKQPNPVAVQTHRTPGPMVMALLSWVSSGSCPEETRSGPCVSPRYTLAPGFCCCCF